MKKFSLVLALIIICIAAFTACGESGGIEVENDTSPVTDSDSGELTVTGLLGEKITLPEKVEKIAVVSDSVSAIMGELGASAMIVGGEGGNVGGLDADVVFADSDASVTGADDAVMITVPAAETVNDIKSLIRLVAEVTGTEDKGEEIVNTMTSALDVAQSMSKNNVKKITAFIDLGDFKTTGSGTYIAELLSAAGNKSVYSEDGYGSMTAEEIAAAAPEMIFTVGDADEYYNNPVFADLDAVKNKRVIELEEDTVLLATNKVTEAVETMSEATATYVTAGEQ